MNQHGRNSVCSGKAGVGWRRWEFECSHDRCPHFSGIRRQGCLLRVVVSMGLR